MKRVLFVDDEQRILEGLQRLLRPQRQVWDMVFAVGGAAAIKELESGWFDVVVTDMRMPEIDGAALLHHVKENYPHMVRIVLSGHAELDSVLRVVAVAHQFLTKPCQPDVLKDAVERACELQALLDNPSLRRLVGQIGALPSRPAEYTSMLRILDDPETSLGDIARVVRRDMAMSAKCLQLVNSAFFGLASHIGNVERAVAYLGVNMIKSLMLSAQVFGLFKVDPRLADLCYKVIPSHALHTAAVASRLVGDRQLSDGAFEAGALGDIGVLVLAAVAPDAYVEILAEAAKSDRYVFEVEREHFGCSHAEIGAYLLGVWGLPYTIVDAVARHHVPREVVSGGVDLSGALHIADALTWDVRADHQQLKHARLDLAYLDRLGVSHQLASWRDLATTLATSLGEEQNDSRTLQSSLH